MSQKKVWLITGAGRGLGADIARAVLDTGDAVVATGRDAARVEAAVGHHANMLPVTLDVTRPRDAHAAVETALARFERIDVLVNNAGNFSAGFFEELGPEQVRNQIDTLLFGPMNVTRAVLPVMRKQRSGLLLTISSTAGIAGQMFCTAYAAAKFGIEGWMESLAPESRRPASPQAPTRCRRSRPRPTRSSSRPTPTASCPAPSPTTPRNQKRSSPMTKG